MAPPPKPMYPPQQGPPPNYPPGQQGAPPPPAGYKPMGPPPQGGAPPPPPAGYKPMGPPPQGGAPPPPPAGYKPMGPPPQGGAPPPAGYKPMGPPPQGGAPPPQGAKPALPPPPPAAMVVAKPPPPKPMAKPIKPKEKKKFFNTTKKKIGVIIMILGIVIAATGFAYPTLYWNQQNAYSSAQLKADQTNSGTLILYTSWDSGSQIKVHDSVVSAKAMTNTVYIEGVTYVQKLSLGGQTQDIGDHWLIELNNGQYLLVSGAAQPNANAGDTILASGEVRMIIGKDSQNNDVRREILICNPIDIEKNDTDNVFLGIGIAGIVVILVGLVLWMFFVYMPEDKGPTYVNIHEERKKDFMDQIGQQTKKEYACPVCGLNMTYKQEFGKWYCEICNKMF